MLCAGVLTFAAACGERRLVGREWRRHHDHVVAQLEQRARQGLLRAGGQGLRGRPPGREDRDQRHGARGHGRQARRGLPERRHPRRLHGARRRRARRPRRGRHGPRPLRRRGGRDRQDRRLGRRLAGRRQDLRAAVLARRGRRLVQHRPLRAGRASPRRRRRWTSGTTTSPSSRPPASRRSRWAPATSGRPRTTGTTPRCASCPEDVLKDAVTSLDFSDPCFVQAGEVVEDLLATEPFNTGFLTTQGPGGRDLGVRPARHRQGRDGAAGPLGARCHAGPHRRRQGPRRQDRLVPVPGRRGRRRATRPTRSAVATPGRSRRRRPTRRSTS